MHAGRGRVDAREYARRVNAAAEQLESGVPVAEAARLLAERFGFKIVAGFALGWLLIRTSPRALLLVTAGLTLTSVAWAMWVPGRPYLLSFGILGAGELFGVYYPNYILGCSPREQMRRNMAFTSLITMPVGFAAIASRRATTITTPFGCRR